MSKRYIVLLASLILIGGLALSFAVVEQNAMALPSYTGACSGCHTADSTVTMTVSKVSETATAITYSVTGSSAYNTAQGWAVFAGSTKLAGGYTAASNQFTVNKGATYAIFWVDKDPSSMKGYATQNLVVPAATTTTTQPTTTTTQPTTTTTRATTTTTQPKTTTTRATTTTTQPTTTTTRATTTTIGHRTTTTRGTTTTTSVGTGGDDGGFDHHWGDGHEEDTWHRFLDGNRRLLSSIGSWFAHIL